MSRPLLPRVIKAIGGGIVGAFVGGFVGLTGGIVIGFMIGVVGWMFEVWSSSGVYEIGRTIATIGAVVGVIGAAIAGAYMVFRD